MKNKAAKLIKTKLWLIQYELENTSISDKRYRVLMDEEVVLINLQFKLKGK